MNSVAKIQPIVANKKRTPNPFCPSIKDRNKAKNPQIEEIKKNYLTEKMLFGLIYLNWFLLLDYFS